MKRSIKGRSREGTKKVKAKNAGRFKSKIAALGPTNNAVSKRLSRLQEKVEKLNTSIDELNLKLEVISADASSDRLINIVADLIKAAGLNTPEVLARIRVIMNKKEPGQPSSAIGMLLEDPRARNLVNRIRSK